MIITHQVMRNVLRSRGEEIAEKCNIDKGTVNRNLDKLQERKLAEMQQTPESFYAARAKERQATSTGGAHPQLLQKSVKAENTQKGTSKGGQC